MTVTRNITQDIWEGCYRGGWMGVIHRSAMLHPAKFSRRLISRIVEHVTEEKWVQPGSTVIDPFAGVSLGGFAAANAGLRWIGVELEPDFTVLSARNITLWSEQWCLCDEQDRVEMYRVREAGSKGIRRGKPDAETEDGTVLQPPLFEPLHLQRTETEFRSQEEVKGPDSLEQREELVDGNETETIGLGQQRVESDGEERQLEGREVNHGGRVRGDQSRRQAKAGAPPRGRSGYGQAFAAGVDSPPREGEAGQQPGRPDADDQVRPHETAPSERSHQAREDDHLRSVQSAIPRKTTREVLPERGVQERTEASSLEKEISQKTPGTFCSTCHKLVVHIPTVLQGDSRKLKEVLASAELTVTSPPYGQRTAHGQTGIDFSRSEVRDRTGHGSQVNTQDQYGEENGNLGNMAMSDHTLAVSSPPYVTPPGHGGESEQWDALAREKELHRPTYGSNNGQLGQMKEGTIDLSLTSPPYSGNSGKHDRTGHERAVRRHERLGFKQGVGCFKAGEAYGNEDGQLGGMEEGDIDACITSPPFTNTDTKPSRLGSGRGTRSDGDGAGRNKGDYYYPEAEGQLGAMSPSDLDACITSPPYNPPMSQDHNGNRGGQRGTTPSEPHAFAKYGNSEGQIEGMSMDGHADACISSPPYAQQHAGGGGINVEGYSKDWQKKDMKDLVGNRTYQGRGADRAEGNLEVMEANDYEASITSPPYEHDSEPHGDLRPDNGDQAAVFIERDYGATDGNISAAPETFWSASKLILEQLFDVLKPGGHAVFVTGDFVRDRKRVRFGEQWRQLCEAVGFVCLHHHIATKTEDRGTQGLLDGGEAEQQSSKISFFRRNHIDNERAAIHWPSITNQADYLTRAETKLRKEYDKRVAAKKAAVPVTEARILQVAQKNAWREDGSPAHDTDIAILNEDVYCFLRP